MIDKTQIEEIHSPTSEKKIVESLIQVLETFEETPVASPI
jgi:hypothetical protein